MKKFIILILILFFQISYSQTKKTYVKKNVFEKSEIGILSAETVESSNNKAVLEMKFIDYSDNKIKYYQADLGKKRYIGRTQFNYLLGAISSISIMTVPFKIRSKNEQGYVTAKADVKNVGLYFPVALWNHKRYWLNNSTTSHKFSVGFLIAPMAQELNNKNTNDYFQNPDTSYNAFMLSTSISLTYTYNSLTFALIPIGFDFGLDEAGKQWDNHSNYWAGVGIGIDTKLFGF